jgi:hypothetical protein
MTDQETVPPVAVPADIDVPDRIAWGLTARQLAILAVAGAAAWAAYRALASTVPPGLLLAAAGGSRSTLFAHRAKAEHRLRQLLRANQHR